MLKFAFTNQMLQSIVDEPKNVINFGLNCFVWYTGFCIRIFLPLIVICIVNKVYEKNVCQ